MKITINLDEFWNEEGDEATISESIKGAILSQVRHEVMTSIKKKVDDQITREVKKAVEEEYTLQIRSFVSSAIKELEMIDPNDRTKSITLEEWVRHQFTKSTGWNSPNDTMKKLADKFSQEMRDRYDALFATQIVVKMSEQGLLKDGMAELLIEKE